MGGFGEQIVKIGELAEKSRDKHKGEELQVAYRFIECYNNAYETDYVLSEKQPLSDDNPVDVLINSKSDSGKILKIQVKTFDPKFRKTINKNKNAGREFLRMINKNEVHPLIIEFKKITHKLDRLDTGIKKELTILFDGFWGFNLRESEIRDLRNLFADKTFKEVWVVSSVKECIKLL